MGTDHFGLLKRRALLSASAGAYGGSAPGPTLRVRQGEPMSIVFENRLDQDTTAAPASPSRPSAPARNSSTSASTCHVDSSGKAARELGAVGLPTTLLIDRAGSEIGRLIGPAEWDAPDMIAFIRRRIDEQYDRP